MESFLRGHLEAFRYFGGVPRAVLYDNLKSAVLERRGEAIRFHPRLLELCGHYHFAPRPVGVARGNEKGRVERQIKYLGAVRLDVALWILAALAFALDRWLAWRRAREPS